VMCCRHGLGEKSFSGKNCGRKQGVKGLIALGILSVAQESRSSKSEATPRLASS
jgi:hypothetical protein